MNRDVWETMKYTGLSREAATQLLREEEGSNQGPGRTW